MIMNPQLYYLIKDKPKYSYIRFDEYDNLKNIGDKFINKRNLEIISIIGDDMHLFSGLHYLKTYDCFKPLDIHIEIIDTWILYAVQETIKIKIKK